jgi:hypothetical protein
MPVKKDHKMCAFTVRHRFKYLLSLTRPPPAPATNIQTLCDAKRNIWRFCTTYSCGTDHMESSVISESCVDTQRNQCSELFDPEDEGTTVIRNYQKTRCNIPKGTKLQNEFTISL